MQVFDPKKHQEVLKAFRRADRSTDATFEAISSNTEEMPEKKREKLIALAHDFETVTHHELRRQMAAHGLKSSKELTTALRQAIDAADRAHAQGRVRM